MNKQNQKPSRATQIGSLLLLGVLCVSTSGCGFLSKRVSAYERGTLSKPGMALGDNPKERAAINHMLNAREGSVGGFGGAGGGCGCN